MLIGRRGEPPGLPCTLWAQPPRGSQPRGRDWQVWVETGPKTDDDTRATLERVEGLEGAEEGRLGGAATAALISNLEAGFRRAEGNGTEKDKEKARRAYGTRLQRGWELAVTVALGFPEAPSLPTPTNFNRLEAGGRPCLGQECLLVAAPDEEIEICECGEALGAPNQVGARLRLVSSKKSDWRPIQWSATSSGRKPSYAYAALEDIGLVKSDGRRGPHHFRDGAGNAATARQVALLLKGALFHGGLEAWLARPTGTRK